MFCHFENSHCIFNHNDKLDAITSLPPSELLNNQSFQTANRYNRSFLCTWQLRIFISMCIFFLLRIDVSLLASSHRKDQFFFLLWLISRKVANNFFLRKESAVFNDANWSPFEYNRIWLKINPYDVVKRKNSTVAASLIATEYSKNASNWVQLKRKTNKKCWI